MKNIIQNDDLVVDELEVVAWDEKFATGLELIDAQHQQLVSITNELFHACVAGDEDRVFKETMSRMVEYVKYHFGAEQQMLLRVKYPDYNDHKKQHDEMVRNILEAVKEYNEGKQFVPNHFVRILRDWILSHIALCDKLYAAFIADQVKKGLLSDREING
jgi:hemerythrin